MAIVLNGSTGIQNVLGSASAPADTNTTTPTTGVYYPSATTWGVSTAGTNALYIDASQNVGIGTTSPISKLHVSAADGQPLTVNGATKAIRIITNSSYAAVQAVDNTGVTSYQPLFVSGSILQLGIGGTEYARMDSSGNVGINTTTMTGKLNVVGSTNGYALYVTDGTYSGGLIPSSSTGGLILYNGVAQPLGFWTNNTERMRIDSSGNLLVNRTINFSPTTGKIAISYAGSGGWGIGIQDTSGAATNYNIVFVNSSGTTIGSISSTSSATAYNTGSDYRLKENVTPMTTGLEKISALKPVTYDWISDKSAGEGFIAHELQAIIPNAVTGEKDAVDEGGKPIHQGVDYSKIVVHLVAALQELKAEFDAYKAAHP